MGRLIFEVYDAETDKFLCKGKMVECAAYLKMDIKAVRKQRELTIKHNFGEIKVFRLDRDERKETERVENEKWWYEIRRFRVKLLTMLGMEIAPAKNPYSKCA